MATSFLVAWQHMQGEVGDTEGPLAQPVQAAGARQDKLQKAITRQRERVRFQQLDVDLRALPADDVRRCAWVNLDPFSTSPLAVGKKVPGPSAGSPPPFCNLAKSEVPPGLAAAVFFRDLPKGRWRPDSPPPH